MFLLLWDILDLLWEPFKLFLLWVCIPLVILGIIFRICDSIREKKRAKDLSIQRANYDSTRSNTNQAPITQRPVMLSREKEVGLVRREILDSDDQIAIRALLLAKEVDPYRETSKGLTLVADMPTCEALYKHVQILLEQHENDLAGRLVLYILSALLTVISEPNSKGKLFPLYLWNGKYQSCKQRITYQNRIVAVDSGKYALHKQLFDLVNKGAITLDDTRWYDSFECSLTLKSSKESVAKDAFYFLSAFRIMCEDGKTMAEKKSKDKALITEMYVTAHLRDYNRLSSKEQIDILDNLEEKRLLSKEQIDILDNLEEKIKEELQKKAYIDAAVHGRHYLEIILRAYYSLYEFDRESLGLGDQIQYLQDNGIISEDESSHLHKLRIISNKGAHYDTSITKEDIRTMLKHIKEEREIALTFRKMDKNKA